MSKWKPGQLVTIEGKVYRIRHTPYNLLVCRKCALRRTCMSQLNAFCDKIEKKYIVYSYFKQVYHKT